VTEQIERRSCRGEGAAMHDFSCGYENASPGNRTP
jgi:hypothetical protein